jgi:hypothetical protein
LCGLFLLGGSSLLDGSPAVLGPLALGRLPLLQHPPALGGSLLLHLATSLIRATTPFLGALAAAINFRSLRCRRSTTLASPRIVIAPRTLSFGERRTARQYRYRCKPEHCLEHATLLPVRTKIDLVNVCFRGWFRQWQGHAHQLDHAPSRCQPRPREPAPGVGDHRILGPARARTSTAALPASTPSLCRGHMQQARMNCQPLARFVARQSSFAQECFDFSDGGSLRSSGSGTWLSDSRNCHTGIAEARRQPCSKWNRRTCCATPASSRDFRQQIGYVNIVGGHTVPTAANRCTYAETNNANPRQRVSLWAEL